MANLVVYRSSIIFLTSIHYKPVLKKYGRSHNLQLISVDCHECFTQVLALFIKTLFRTPSDIKSLLQIKNVSNTVFPSDETVVYNII